MDLSTVEQKQEPERINAELRYLAYFWKGYFIQESFGIDFYFLTPAGRNTLKQFLDSGKIKELNKFLFRPQVTRYFLESIIDGLWAIPDKVFEAVSHKLGREFPAENEFEKKISCNVLFEEPQILVRDALERIHENETGVSLLSGYELMREPFQGLKFEQLYCVDMCYLDKIALQDTKKFKEHLRNIFNESCSKPSEYDIAYRMLCDKFCESPLGALRSGLFVTDVREGETFLNWVMHRKNSSQLFKEKTAVPLLGNAEDLRSCQVINTDTLSVKPFCFADASLDFALIIGIDWLDGNYMRAVCEAERVLKEHAKIIISGYHPDAFKLPKSGMWAGHTRNWKIYAPIEDLMPLKSVLLERGFAITEKTAPNLYWCIVGER